jgi:DNA-binding GntR family transcriptional regulator
MDISQNKPLKEIIYEAMRQSILMGEIPTGTRINEKKFAEQTNTSRTPVRYALQKLCEEKLVDYVPGNGMIVKGISQKDAKEIFEIRKSLDFLATKNTMNHMDDVDFQHLDALLSYTEKKNEAGEVDEVIRLFSEFNQFIYNKNEMPRLHSIVIGIQDYLSYFRNLSLYSKERRRAAIGDHRKIFYAMQKKDEEELEALINRHLDDSLFFILEEMKRREIA